MVLRSIMALVLLAVAAPWLRGRLHSYLSHNSAARPLRTD